MVAVLALALFALAVLVITKAENTNLGIVGLLLGVGGCMLILGARERGKQRVKKSLGRLPFYLKFWKPYPLTPNLFYRVHCAVWE